MLQVKKLSLTYGEKSALSGLDWQMEEGEVWSLVGPNGAGKSSLIKCLLGLVEPTSGEIYIQGRPLAQLSRIERARFFSYVPQAGNLQLPFTVEELVAQGRYPHQKPFQPLGRSDKRAIEKAMQQTGVSKFAKAPLSSLSGGERQIALIAAALAQEAKILVLDEGLTYLDYQHQKAILDCLQRLNAEEQSILTVHHDLNHSFALGGKALALKRGESLFQGPVGELANAKLLQKIYSLDLTRVNHPVHSTPLAFL